MPEQSRDQHQGSTPPLPGVFYCLYIGLHREQRDCQGLQLVDPGIVLRPQTHSKRTVIS
ncbi:MAG: hypothetical protein QNK79_09220 [Synechococcus sp. ArSW.bin.68]